MNEEVKRFFRFSLSYWWLLPVLKLTATPVFPLISGSEKTALRDFHGTKPV